MNQAKQRVEGQRDNKAAQDCCKADGEYVALAAAWLQSVPDDGLPDGQ